MKILLKGYYGFGNLGDDVLLLTTYRLVKKKFPKSIIYIYSDSRHNDYLRHFISEEIKVINYSYNGYFDYVIHGGGGVHFDFKKGNLKSYLLNKICRITGFKVINNTYRFYKNSVRKQTGIESGKRIGLGLGIGTFTPDSVKFFLNFLTLNSYNSLIVRDSDSIENLKKIAPGVRAVIGSDLAFLSELWIPQNLSQSVKNDKNVGIILRDWALDNSYLQNFLLITDQLIKENFNITVFSFDEEGDKEFINKFNKYPVKIWNPHSVKLKDFMGLLADQKVIISSRAHGAILSACLGVPSLCIEIEPKLKVVAEMLENSASLVRPDISFKELMPKLNRAIYIDSSSKDVSYNNGKIRAALESINF